jgi:NitT/TauT family transport system permease protein
MLFRIILPGAAASVFTGLRLGLEMSFFMLIAAEMIGANYGLGWLLLFSAMNVQIGLMYSAIRATVFLGFAMNTGLKSLYTRVFFWREELRFSGKENSGKARSLKSADLVLSGVLALLIIAAGTWQVGVAKAELANFGKEPHRHHLSMTGYSAE